MRKEKEKVPIAKLKRKEKGKIEHGGRKFL
jgi:hypothetical protein